MTVKDFIEVFDLSNIRNIYINNNIIDYTLYLNDDIEYVYVNPILAELTVADLNYIGVSDNVEMPTNSFIVNQDLHLYIKTIE